MISIQDVIRKLKDIAPLHHAESWDNVGLLLGDAQVSIKKVMTCLTVTEEVVEEALNEDVGLIVSHHPIMFKPIQAINTTSSEGRMLWRLARHGIAVYSPHTAYDNARGGINEQLAVSLGMRELKPLVANGDTARYKLVVFVPEKDLNRVSDALFLAGCGVIGHYEQCSYRLQGTGTFYGTAATNPTVGRAGQREEASEYRLEVVCAQHRLTAAISTLKQAHSYEEPAFDIYPLAKNPLSTSTEGSGRIGKLAVPLSPQGFAERVAHLFHTPVQLTGQKHRAPIETVAIVCGAGGSLLNEAIKAKADAFLTGEIRFHEELAAESAGITIVAAGHYATERPGVEELARQLSLEFAACTVWASRAEQNPARWITFPSNSTSA